MYIKQIPCIDAPMDLLLEADPSPERIAEYLHQSTCFAAIHNEDVIGICLIMRIAPKVDELVNMAVLEAMQRKGVGTELLKYAIDRSRKGGVERIEVSTATIGHYAHYYQRHGFRPVAIDRDFFLLTYPLPLFEFGMQHKDSMRLALDFACSADAQTRPAQAVDY